MSAYKCTFRLRNRAGDCTSRSCGAHSVKKRRWTRRGRRRTEEKNERTNERATASRSLLLLDSYPRSLVLICLLGFRATGQNSSCLSFSALFRLTDLSLSLSFSLSLPLPPVLCPSSFSFHRPFFSLRHLASNPSLAAGTLKGLLAAPSCRKERGNSGNSSEAFSNRIPHCRLGNSRRIEITHYLVMSGAFTSTRGCTRGGWCVRPRHATMLHLHSRRSKSCSPRPTCKRCYKLPDSVKSRALYQRHTLTTNFLPEC